VIKSLGDRQHRHEAQEQHQPLVQALSPDSTRPDEIAVTAGAALMMMFQTRRSSKGTTWTDSFMNGHEQSYQSLSAF